MRPFFFGRSEAPLFGIHHQPAAGEGTRAGGAVLLCNPFGQEAIRAHRIFGVLAAKLSRLGFHVLRFDYTGTGDSSGELDDGRQEQWLDDIAEGHEELLASAGVARATWVGLRYGATLAVLAAEKMSREIGDLVLWDPVVSGAGYLGELADVHAAYMREDLPSWRPPPRVGEETLGFPLGADLRGAMGAVDLSAPRRPKARRVTVVASRQAPDLDRLQGALPSWAPPGRWLPVTSSSPWNSDEAMNSALIPTDVLDAIVTRIREDRSG